TGAGGPGGAAPRGRALNRSAGLRWVSAPREGPPLGHGAPGAGTAQAAAGAGGPPPRLVRRPPRLPISPFSHPTRRQVALKIEEYVPEMIPIRSASTKVRIVVPPSRSSDVRVKTTARLVLIDRSSV